MGVYTDITASNFSFSHNLSAAFLKRFTVEYEITGHEAAVKNNCNLFIQKATDKTTLPITLPDLISPYSLSLK